jgi:formylglycine-generating enzyme required for sulfatase activity
MALAGRAPAEFQGRTMMLPIPVPMPVAQGIIYGITRALGEVWSRVAGNKVTIKAEKDLKERQFWLQELHLDLEGQSLAFEKAKSSAQMLLDREKHQDRLEFERERLRQQLTLEREKMHAHAMERVQEIQLSAELKQIYEHHPIRLTPRTFQRDYTKDRVPLHIVLVPPKGPGGIDEMRNLLPEIEDELLAFVQEHYHAATSSHPAKLLTETWIPGRPCGSSAVQGLFGLLEGVPMLIVEAVSLASGLSMRIGFWGLEQNDSSYARIGTIPWTALAIDPAKIPLDPTASGAAVRTESLIAADRLLPWYRLILATTLDQFHLLQSGAKPLMPRILTEILAGAEASNEAFEPLVASTLEAYRQIYAAFAIAHGALASDLMLDLAEALVEADRDGEAQQALYDALNALVALRSESAEGDALTLIQKCAQPADAPLLERAAVMFERIEDTAVADQLRAIMTAQTPRLANPRSWTPGRIFRDIEAPWLPVMVVIPTGKFLMGDSSADNESAHPKHLVQFRSPFALGQYAITFDEFDAFIDHSDYPYNPPAPWGRGRMPVVNVSWDDAMAYCDWLSDYTNEDYSIPSEAEWEYACRAGSNFSFSFDGRLSKEIANYGDRVSGSTVEVDKYSANAFGLFQMHGNVSEWCRDTWHQNYMGAPVDGTGWITGGEAVYRVARGGSWRTSSYACRSDRRGYFRADDRNNHTGFRVARRIVD